MNRWLITLTGTEDDLARLVEGQGGGDWQIFHHERWGVVLCSQKFEDELDYEAVSKIADALISLIDISAKHFVTKFQGVERDKIVEQLEDSGRVVVKVGLAAEVGASSIVAVNLTTDGTILQSSAAQVREEQAKEIRRLIALQEAHPDLVAAVKYLQEEPDMYGLYKAGEAILRVLGQPKKWDVLVRLRWTTDDDLRRFTRTTHMKRHHRNAGLEKPMKLSEAGAYIRDLLAKLIDRLDGQS